MDAKYIKAMKPRDLTEEEKQRPYAVTKNCDIICFNRIS